MKFSRYFRIISVSHLFLGLSVFLLFVPALKAADSTAYFYENEVEAKQNKKFVFKLISKETKTVEGSSEKINLTATFESQAGDIVLIEKGELSNGEVLRYEVDLKQIEESALVELQGSKIKASFTEKGKKKTREFERPSRFVLPANYVDFVQRNWDELSQKKKIQIQFYVWQRLDYYQFDLIDKGEEKFPESDQKYRHFRLEPSSSFLSIFVSPIEMWFHPQTKQIMRYKGRVTPLVSRDSKLKAFDAVVIYNY